MEKFTDKEANYLGGQERIFYYSLKKHEINAIHSLVSFYEKLRSAGFEFDDILKSHYDVCLMMYQKHGILNTFYLEKLYGIEIAIYYKGIWQGQIIMESPKVLKLRLHWVEIMKANADMLYTTLQSLDLLSEDTKIVY